MFSTKFVLVSLIIKTINSTCSTPNDKPCSTTDIPCFQFNCICLILTIIILIELIILIVIIWIIIVRFKNETKNSKVMKFKQIRQQIRN